MEKYGFFNSVNNDRVYDASDVAGFLSKFFTNGIFNNGLQVVANDNMTVNVASGNANINGYSYENTEELTLDIDEADSELNRIDSVVVRLNLTNRQITTMVLTGLSATSPSQPSIVRSGNIYDLRLANILIEKETTKITTSMITDTRFTTDCGNVTSTVLQLDTDDIFQQYEACFNEWFANLQSQLDSNQAGHLQNEIDTVNTKINNLLDVIYPIGSIYTSINSINPSTFLGGEWEQIKDVFLLACGDKYLGGTKGGEATHVLSVDEIPEHTHTQKAHQHKSLRYSAQKVAAGAGYMAVFTAESTNGEYQGYTNEVTATNNVTGGGLAHNNMPPFLAVYTWVRKA